MSIHALGRHVLWLYESHRLGKEWANTKYVGLEAIQDIAERTGDFLQVIQRKTTKVEISRIAVLAWFASEMKKASTFTASSANLGNPHPACSNTPHHPPGIAT